MAEVELTSINPHYALLILNTRCILSSELGRGVGALIWSTWALVWETCLPTMGIVRHVLKHNGCEAEVMGDGVRKWL